MMDLMWLTGRKFFLIEEMFCDLDWHNDYKAEFQFRSFYSWWEKRDVLQVVPGAGITNQCLLMNEFFSNIVLESF